MKDQFKDIKEGDFVLIKSVQMGKTVYSQGVISRVTPTRMTVLGLYFKEDGKVFTKDGYPYPRQSGFSSSFIELKPYDDEAKKLIVRSETLSSMRRLNSFIGRMIESNKFINNITDESTEEKDLLEIEHCIAELRKKLERYM